MELNIPIYIEATRDYGQDTYRCRPLFFQGDVISAPQLPKATSRLARKLKSTLDRVGRLPRHNALLEMGFSPDLEVKRLKFTIDLRDRIVNCRLPVVIFQRFERRIAFSPRLPDLWFEIKPREDLTDRAAEVYGEHLRQVHKSRRDDAVSELIFTGKAWASTLVVDVRTDLREVKEEKRRRAALWDDEILDGEAELEKVGYCLDWLYPDELNRAILRDGEVAELTRLLTGPEKQPVLLLGPQQSGKTTVLHEYVFHAVKKRKNPHTRRRNVWLLSPGRLISGMSYVGQWQERLLSILEVAERRNHILYFNDVLGLFDAGISAQNNLCVANVLKTHLQQQRIRVVAEMTQTQLHALQQRDRAMADLFHVVPVPEMSQDDTRMVLIRTQQRLEQQYRCKFNLEVLPTVLEVQRRYLPEAAFPGKAALFLDHLAAKLQRQEITRESVYQEFHAKTGLALWLLDPRQKVRRAEVLEKLSRRVIGQRPALEAAADAITVAKARINDPHRPLATFLFLGPTGTGKTQCARSMAQYLFGDESKLLRFDMNELVSPYAVARLVGTIQEPEGLLTAAVRRQPFCVVLLDEIEKAHPDMFDLLLQVLGEGRLTDALGRTANFAGAIVVMTSNLGTRTANTQAPGFRTSDAVDNSHHFERAAEKFFRPEFFNRLDRVIPFAQLSRDEVREIAQLLLHEVFVREGLVRRRSILQVDPEAMERVVDQGYHPQLGARAMKRAIERELTAPVAEGLAGMRPDSPTVVSLYPTASGIAAYTQELVEAEAVPSPAVLDWSTEQTVERALDAVERVEEEIQQARPQGSFSASDLSTEHHWYFAASEQCETVRQLGERLSDELAVQETTPLAVSNPRPRRMYAWSTTPHSSSEPPPKRLLKELQTATDVQAALNEMVTRGRPFAQRMQGRLAELRHESALLRAIVEAQSLPDQALLYLRSIVPTAAEPVQWLNNLYLELFNKALDSSRLELPEMNNSEAALLISGPHAWPLVRAEQGTHLFCDKSGLLVPVQVLVRGLEPHEDPLQVAADFADRRRQWLAELKASEAASAADPFPLAPVLRIYQQEGATLDLRSRLTVEGRPQAGDVRTFILAAMPLPQELEVLA